MDIKILFAIPSHNNTISCNTVQSLLKSFSILTAKGIKYKLKTYQGSLISRLRNEIAHDFLKLDYTHLLFIDSDVSGFENLINKMIENKEKMIIGGIYPKKCFSNYFLSFNIQNRLPLFETSTDFNVNLLDEDLNKIIDNNNDNVIQVRHLATGCMMINRKVFDILENYVDTYRDNNEIIHNFFGCFIENESFLSEDYAFCSICRKNDINVWAIIDVELHHEGYFSYYGNYLDYIKKFNLIKNKFGERKN